MRDVGMLLLELVPAVLGHEPGDRVAFGDHGGGAGRAGEEGQLAAGGAGDDALVEGAVRLVVLGPEDAVLEQVEAVRRVAATEDDRPDRVLAPLEEGRRPPPEVVALVRQVVEGLEDERQRLAQVVPSRRRRRLLLVERLVRDPVQVQPPRRAECGVEAEARAGRGIGFGDVWERSSFISQEKEKACRSGG